nr:protein HEG homolog 1 [Pogona vitticeps]
MRTRKGNAASASTVDMAALETGTLSRSSPKMSIGSLSESNHLATENSYHTDSSWNAGITTSNFHSESRGSSTETKRDAERTSLFLPEGVTLTDSTRRNSISGSQAITSFDQVHSSSRAIHSRGIGGTSDVTSLPDSSVGTVLTHSYFSLKTTAEDRHLQGSSSNTDRNFSTSPVESTYIVGLPDRSGERTLRTLQTLRDISSSYNPTQISTFSRHIISNSDSPYIEQTGQMDLSPGNTDLAGAMASQSQAPSESIAVEESDQPGSSLHRDRSVLSSHTDSGSVLGVSDRDGERTLPTLRDNATEMSTDVKPKSSSTVGLTQFSSMLTPVQTTQMDVSARDSVITEAAVLRSQTPSKRTAVEDSGLLRRSLNTRTSVPSSHRRKVSTVGLSNISEEILLALEDTSGFYNATQISTISSNKPSSNLGLTDSSYVSTPVQTRKMDLSPGDSDVRNITPSEITAVEDSGLLKWNSNKEDVVSSSEAESISVPGVSGRVGERTLRTLRDVSSSLNKAERATTSSNEVFSSLGPTDSSSVLTPVEVGQIDLSPENTDITPLESTALEDISQPRSSSDTQRGVSQSPIDNTSALDLSDRGGERTLQTIRDISTSHIATQVSIISGKEISSSSDLTDFSSMLTSVQMGQTDLSPGDTEGMVTESQPASETTAVEDRGLLRWSSNTEQGVSSPESESAPVPDLFDKGEVRTLQTLRDTSHSHNATQKATDSSHETLHSLDLTDSSSLLTPVQTEQMDMTTGDMNFTQATLKHSQTPSEITGHGSSPQMNKELDAERRLSSAATDSVYRSTAFTHGGARTSRSLPDNSTSTVAIDSSTYKSDNSNSSEPILTLASVTEMEKDNVSLSEEQSTGPSTEHLSEYSSLIPMYSPSPKDSSTAGSSPHSVRSSNHPQSSTESTYTLASFSNGEGVIKTTFSQATESPSLNREELDSSEVNPSSPEVYSRGTDPSTENLGIYGSSTEILQSLHSPRTPSYFSFQSESSNTETDSHPMNSNDTGKRTSVSHTDITFTSTTFTRGGERTLLSVLNSSTLPDSSESSTFHVEISSPSELTQTIFSENQSRSNTSSNYMDFSAPSTEPLDVYSQKIPEYPSTVSEPHTIQFSSKSESIFSSSSFPSSLSTSQKQDSYSPTQPPTLFSSSEPSFPSLSSTFPSTLSSPSQTPSVTFSHRLSSTALLPLPSLRPSVSSSSSPLQPSRSLETSVSMSTSGGTTGLDPHTAASAHTEHSHQTKTYMLKDSTVLRSTGPSPLLTEMTEPLTNLSSPVTISLEDTPATKGQNVSLQGTNHEKSVPMLTTSPTYFPESTMVSETAKATTPTLPSTTTPKDAFNLVETTTGKKLTEVTYTTLRIPTLVAGTDVLVSTKPHKIQPSSTMITYATEMPIKGTKKTSTTTAVVQEHIKTTTQPPVMLSSSKTSRGASPVPPVSTKATTIVWFGSTKIFPASPGKDVDECLYNPCPALATCTNTQGSFHCTCSLGYQMEKGKCNLVRTFVGQFPLLFNTTGGKYSELHQIEEGIKNMLNDSLSMLPGYYTSTVKTSRQLGTIQVSVLSTFSLISNVTLYDVVSAVRNHIQACKAPTETCQFISNFTLLHRAGGLCKHKDPECDKETSVCVDLDGIAVCRCRPGYFKYNKLDHSCRACEDGYKLENDTCVSCPFGLGGFNCGNPYQLITIVIAAAGGGLLLILGIALIVTCCQKNKNDISKFIFKSGDFQMSPYAEYPKNPRAQDWGRESIEMQENGSTKNLLQMTDVYYMPTNLRNPELERNGIYPPYTGLPGSRHSCIYPGQYNPSFISDDSRRRDYF